MYCPQIIRPYIITFLMILPITINAGSYYVSPTGNDNNSGTGASSAWATIAKVNGKQFAPGDTLFLQGGALFSGNITFDASDGGVATSPVVVTSYGTGSASINGGNGHGIRLTGTVGMTICNVNVVGSGRNINSRGVGIYCDAAQNIIVDQVDASGFQIAGVLITNGSSNVRVTRVYAHDNGYTGIGSGYYYGTSATNRNIYVGYCRANNNPGISNTSAYINDQSGSGINMERIDGGIIEYCEAANNGYDFYHRSGNGPVGIWTYRASNVVIQNCISHDNKSMAWDGGGFDFDGITRNSVLQYCYSYNNHGPAVLLCAYDSVASQRLENDTVRYCISENDGVTLCKSNLQFQNGHVHQNVFIYNNVFYNSNGRSNVVGRATATTHFWNNIFIINGTGKFIDPSFSPMAIFQGNCYWNTSGASQFAQGITSIDAWRTSTGVEMLNGNPVGINADPKLVLPGFGERLTDPTKLSGLFSYLLQPNSPCIDSGLNLPTLYGMNTGVRDFFGNHVPFGKYDIGAHEYQSERSIQISIVQPLTGRFFTVQNSVRIEAQIATVNGSIPNITKVEFFSDTGTTRIGEDINGADGWSCTWNTALSGVYYLLARATDNTGRIGNSGFVKVTVVDMPVRIPENPAGVINGLDYKYFEGDWQVLPNFLTLTPRKTGSVASIHLLYKMRDTLFGFSFSGFLDVPSDGIYTFFTNSDAGSALYIGNTRVVNNDGVHAAREDSGHIALSAGKHAIRIDYFEQKGTPTLTVNWQRDNLEKQPIPAMQWYHLSVGVVPVRPFKTLQPTLFQNGNKIIIHFSDHTLHRITMFDQQGRQVKSLTVTGTQKCLLDVSVMRPGFYVFDIQTVGKRFREKLLVL